MVLIGGGSAKFVLSDRWRVYTKSRKQLLHRKYLLYETGCILGVTWTGGALIPTRRWCSMNQPPIYSTASIQRYRVRHKKHPGKVDLFMVASWYPYSITSRVNVLYGLINHLSDNELNIGEGLKTVLDFWRDMSSKLWPPTPLLLYFTLWKTVFNKHFYINIIEPECVEMSIFDIYNFKTKL